MKILVVAHESIFLGGANKALFAILEYWKKNIDIQFDVLVPKQEGEFVEKLKSLGINVIVYKYYKVFSEKKNDGKNLIRHLNVLWKFLYNSLKSISIARKIEKNKYDLVYSNTRMTSIGISIAKRLKIPHIMHIREFGNKETIWGPSNIKRICKYSSKIIVITNALKDFLESQVKVDKFCVSYDGVNYFPYKRVKNGMNGTINLLIAGRLAKAKGQDEAIKALSILKQNKINNIKLNIVGDLPGNTKYEYKYKEYLEDLVNKYNLNDDVIFHGNRSDLNEFRKKMDIELMCSECETFGWVTVEGMRSGLIVIGSNVGGTLEIINDNENGFLYEQGNPQDLAEKIEFVLKEKNENINKIRENAYYFANKNFTVEKNAKEIYEILKNIERKI